MILVTGGAGFIGSNLLRALNARGEDRILVVDRLGEDEKFRNLVGARIAEYFDKEDFAEILRRRDPILDRVEAVLHQGACSSTTVRDGRYMLRNNQRASKDLLDFTRERGVPLIYASSAAVYGAGQRFMEEPSCEAPLNVYGYSKLLFDEQVRRLAPGGPQVVGLRYFNVYGPREAHKGSMASVAFHLRGQLLRDGIVRLFEGRDGFGDGEQRRDFIHVDDVVATILWFLDHPERSGIFNVGTGEARPFNDVARAVLAHYGRGSLRYVPFPEVLMGKYQSHTCADLARLRAAGCDVAFRPVARGVMDTMAWLDGGGT